MVLPTPPHHGGVRVQETPVDMADDISAADVISEAPADGMNTFISQLSEAGICSTDSLSFFPQLSAGTQPLGPPQSERGSTTFGSGDGTGRIYSRLFQVKANQRTLLNFKRPSVLQ